jgi:hypothetical protein
MPGIGSSKWENGQQAIHFKTAEIQPCAGAESWRIWASSSCPSLTETASWQNAGKQLGIRILPKPFPQGGKRPLYHQNPSQYGLLEISEKIQDYLGFKCEIEYIVSRDGKSTWSRPKTFHRSKHWMKKKVKGPYIWTASEESEKEEIIGNGPFL